MIKNLNRIHEEEITSNTIIVCESTSIVQILTKDLMDNGYHVKMRYLPTSVLYDNDIQIFITVEPTIILSMTNKYDLWFCSATTEKEDSELYALTDFQGSDADFQNGGVFQIYMNYCHGKYGGYAGYVGK